jgi:hypothetical protein
MYSQIIEELADEDLGAAPAGKAVLEYALGVDPGYLKKKIDEIGTNVSGIQLLLWLAAAGGVSAAVVSILSMRKR